MRSDGHTVHDAVALRLVCLLALTVTPFGCAFVAKVHYDARDGISTDKVIAGDDPELFGVAVSGGGSRAAVFGAAGLEALWEHGLLERIDYISSVSGGSIAAGYYVKKRLGDGEIPDEEFFARFKSRMRQDFWSSIEWRQFSKFRWFSGTRRATSFKEVLDRQFLDGFKLGELDGFSPHLLVNATLYDNGRTFVITTLAQEEVEYDFGESDGATRALAGRSAVRPMTFAHEEVLGAVPGDLPLSLAVAASAAVPFVFGPVAVQVDSRYWHLGDGGLFDNSGLATLVHVMLGKLQDREDPGRALFIVLDSGRRPDEEALTRERNFHAFEHPERVFEIPSYRAEAYHDLVWSALRQEQSRHEIEKYVMLYTEVTLDPRLLPESCASEPVLCPEPVCADALQDHIRHIPTHLKISDCDADLMELVAHVGVHEKLEAKFPRVRGCALLDRVAAGS